MNAINTAADQIQQTAHCSCGTVELKLSGKPLIRGYCHCTTCQAYTGSDYSDVTVFRATDVQITDESSVEFQGYQTPSLAQRGKCVNCHNPTHEKIVMPVLPNLIIVSTEILPESMKLEPSMHIFYHRRVQDISDQVPRHHGFIKSQAVFMGALFKSLWQSRQSSRA